MTSVRSKRNLKVPNRFSSDNSQIETSNANGETIIDYNDNSTSTTHNLVPINRTIKLKPALREPLKVKLPKLKRSNNLQSFNNNTNNPPKTHEVKIHKIKLPSTSSKKSTNSSKSSPPSSSQSSSTSLLSSTKSAQSSNKNDSNKIKSSSSTINKTNKLETSANVIKDNSSQINNTSIDKKLKEPIPPINNTNSIDNTFGSSLLQKKPTSSQQNKQSLIGSLSILEPTTKLSSQHAQSKLDASTSYLSPVNNGDKSSLVANTSFSSDDTADGNNSSSRMEIVVSQPDSSNNNNGIRCPCGVDDDLGVMVECENCSTWQHGHCINVGAEDDAYEGYICGFCTLQDRARDSLLQLTVGDKFQSRFKSLESLKKQTSSSNSEEATKNNFNDTTENNAHLTINELTQATDELKRVLNSLKIKWKLFEKPTYEAELRIWANSFWSEDQTDNSDKNLYYMDRCRGNLKFNIRNMLKKMDKRCQLIDFAISNIQSKGNNQPSSDILNKLRDSVSIIAQSVKEYKNKMKALTS